MKKSMVFALAVAMFVIISLFAGTGICFAQDGDLIRMGEMNPEFFPGAGEKKVVKKSVGHQTLSAAWKKIQALKNKWEKNPSDESPQDFVPVFCDIITNVGNNIDRPENLYRAKLVGFSLRPNSVNRVGNDGKVSPITEYVPFAEVVVKRKNGSSWRFEKYVMNVDLKRNRVIFKW